MNKKGPKPKPAIDRFMTRVQKTQTCWLWTGGQVRSPRKRNAYGVFSVVPRHGASTYTTAHRFAYMHFIGPIPDGYHVDHLCKNTLCVNPAHLEAVSPAMNNLRSNSRSSINARKTHCPIGHAYAEHVYVNPNTGKRTCKTCSNAAARAYYCAHRKPK